ncbi:MAG: chemotaxis response regulator protein-glutamate methylesterase [Planctomycetaceae bacterium]|jgi:two-component system chemotaxis response regulator CheB|nr:chemotaxis response regulator protein-glutamate methylesterase [Planctomycetaceae bacterium]
MSEKPIRVIVVDDSLLVRQILSQGLEQDPEIHVVATASDPYAARDEIARHKPDVLTLDVEMPRMNGVEFLQKMMPQCPIPVVMVSSLTERGQKITMDALAAGAVDFVAKPKANIAMGLNQMMEDLRDKVRAASRANVSRFKVASYNPVKKGQSPASQGKVSRHVIAIGASTGGTEALKEVLTTFTPDMPGTVVVQHMPAGFTRMFAERLNSLCAVEVKEAEEGDMITDGKVIIAAGGRHLEVVRRGTGFGVRLYDGPTVCGHKPSVEVMMTSVSKNVGKAATGVMLTGMGGDGAGGMKAMRNAGARCIAQDEATSVVFGMPCKAYENGGAEKLVPLPQITRTVKGLLH